MVKFIMFKMSFLYPVVVSCLLSASAMAAESKPFEGSWSLAKEYCASTSGDGSDYKVTIQDRTFKQYEMECIINSIAGSEKVWRLDLSCEFEGKVNRTRAKLTMTAGGKLLIEQPARSNLYVRCDAAVPAPQFNGASAPPGVLIRGELAYGVVDSTIGDYSFLTSSHAGDTMFESCKLGKDCEIRAKVKGDWIREVLSVKGFD